MEKVWLGAWQAGLLLLSIFLAWRITALGFSGVQLDHLNARGDAAAVQVIDWYPGQAAALAQLGSTAAARKSPDAERMLTDAYLHGPTGQRPLLLLAGLARARGDLDRADALAERVDGLRPVDAWVQRDLGIYWLERGQPERAVFHWGKSLASKSELSPRLFEGLRRLAMEPAADAAFQTLANNPPGWWQDFFSDTAKRDADVAVLRRLYGLRRESTGAPLTAAERRVFFERLIRERMFEDAYIAWVNSLTGAQRRQLGLLYNGSFEAPLSGFGFDWGVTKVPRAEVQRARVEGTDQHALVLRFKLLRVPYEHIAQPLALGSGLYQVAGSTRGIDLSTEGGFRWEARCLYPESLPLGQSERIFPTEEWASFRFEIEVPESCSHQELRLRSADGTVLEKAATDGELWFDEMSISRIDALSPLGKAKIDMLRQESGKGGSRAGMPKG